MWVAIERYQRLVVGEERIPNAMLVVGPFDTEEEVQGYAEWVYEQIGPDGVQIATGKMVPVPEEFRPERKDADVPDPDSPPL